MSEISVAPLGSPGLGCLDSLEEAPRMIFRQSFGVKPPIWSCVASVGGVGECTGDVERASWRGPRSSQLAVTPLNQKRAHLVQRGKAAQAQGYH